MDKIDNEWCSRCVEVRKLNELVEGYNKIMKIIKQTGWKVNNDKGRTK